MAEHLPPIAALQGLPGGIGSITRVALGLRLNEKQGDADAVEVAQDRHRIRVPDAQAVFERRTVQSLMRAVLDAPVFPVGSQQFLGPKLGRLPAGREPDDFGDGFGGELLGKVVVQE